MAKLTLKPFSSNGSSSGGKADLAVAAPQRDWARIGQLLGDLAPKSDQLKAFPDLPGSDTEPWDVLLGLLAVDEFTGLQKLATRTGLTFQAEPRLAESAAPFYEIIPPSIARQHQVAGVSADVGAGGGGAVMHVATSQPFQPAVFAMLEEKLGVPVRLILSPRGAVTNLINRGYEQRQDLVTEIVEEMPLDQRAIESAAGSVKGSTDLLQLARQTPVIRLVNMILFEALRRAHRTSTCTRWRRSWSSASASTACWWMRSVRRCSWRRRSRRDSRS
ncbi:MAG: hypothetical protein QM783_02505 [Phycisphaerales bacterium]